MDWYAKSEWQGLFFSKQLDVIKEKHKNVNRQNRTIAGLVIFHTKVFSPTEFSEVKIWLHTFFFPPRTVTQMKQASLLSLAAETAGTEEDNVYNMIFFSFSVFHITFSFVIQYTCEIFSIVWLKERMFPTLITSSVLQSRWERERNARLDNVLLKRGKERKKKVDTAVRIWTQKVMSAKALYNWKVIHTTHSSQRLQKSTISLLLTHVYTLKMDRSYMVALIVIVYRITLGGVLFWHKNHTLLHIIP